MADQTTPSGATISVENFVTNGDATVAAAETEADLFPKENLLSPYRHKRWRSTNTSVTDIDIDLGTEKIPTVLAIIDSNIGISNTPRDILENTYNLWLKGSTISGVLDGGDMTEIWADQSPEGRDAYMGGSYQTIASGINTHFMIETSYNETNYSNGSQVTILPDETGGLFDIGLNGSGTGPKYTARWRNGSPGLYFLGDRIMPLLISRSLGTAHVISFAVEVLSSTGSRYIFSDNADCNIYFSGTNLIYQNTASSSVTFAVNQVVDERNVITLLRSGTSVLCYKNGTLISAEVLSSNTAFSCSLIGAKGTAASPTSGHNGYLGDMIFDTATTNSDIITDYIGRKYNIVTTRCPVYTSTPSPGVTFDSANALAFEATHDLGSAQTVTVVFTMSSSMSGVGTFIGDSDTNCRVSINTVGPTLSFQAQGSSVGVTQAVSTDTLHIYTVRRDGATVDFFLDGVLVGTVGGAGTSSFMASAVGSNTVIGNNYDWYGNIHEIILSESAWEDEYVYSTHRYLSSDYDITITAEKKIKLQSITGVDGSARQTWTYSLYDTSTNNKIQRWYIGNDNSGDPAEASRYWRLRIVADTTLDNPITGVPYTYFEIGCIWLGQYTEMIVSEKAKISTDDASKSDSAYDGSEYVDIIDSTHDVNIKLETVPIQELFDLKEILDGCGASTPVLLDIYAPQSDDALKAHGTFYGYITSKGVKFNHKEQVVGSMDIDFEEMAK